MSVKIGCFKDRAAYLRAKKFCQSAFTDWEIVQEGERILYNQVEDGTLDYVMIDAWKAKHKLPYFLEPALTLPRESARNVIVFHRLQMLDDLIFKARVGVQNSVEAAQLGRWRKDIVAVSVEKPTDECLVEFTKGDFDAFILPKADLDRLAMTGILKYEILIPPIFLGLPGQGITYLAKKKDREPKQWPKDVMNDVAAERELRAELAFRNRFVDGTTPYGIYAWHEGAEIQMMAQLTDETGVSHYDRMMSGKDPEELGKTLYKKLMEMLQ